MQDTLTLQWPENTPEVAQPLLTIQALAALLGVSRPTIYALMRKGLPYIKLGRCLRFSLPSVQQWITEHEHTR